MNFKDFNFDERLLEGLQSMGYTTPTSIQEKAIPVILNDKDIIACAQTGTGKTGAYILPILHKIINANAEKRHLNTLVIAPTRELAQQIDQQIEGFAYFSSISSIPVYGGGDGDTWSQQKKALEEGADIIIATPGRLIAQLTSGSINLSHVQHLILDEADRMLDMGFFDDILRIISYLPTTRQTILFSATMPPKIRILANKILREPEEVNIAISKPAAGIVQQAYLAYDKQKSALVRHILKEGEYNSIIIFSSTKENVKNLSKELHQLGLSIKAFHSDLEQEEREKILREFKSRQLRIIIGTDVLSRGIDIEGIDLVINLDVPPDPEDYIHRIGRTARAEAKGTAITFISDKDQQKFFRIESMIGMEVPKIELPAHLGEGPLYQPEAKVKKSNHGNKKRGPWKDQNRRRGRPGEGGNRR